MLIQLDLFFQSLAVQMLPLVQPRTDPLGKIYGERLVSNCPLVGISSSGEDHLGWFKKQGPVFLLQNTQYYVYFSLHYAYYWGKPLLFCGVSPCIYHPSGPRSIRISRVAEVGGQVLVVWDLPPALGRGSFRVRIAVRTVAAPVLSSRPREVCKVHDILPRRGPHHLGLVAWGAHCP